MVKKLCLFLVVLLFFARCDLHQPDKVKLLYGEWEWEKARNDKGNDIMEDFNFVKLILKTSDSFEYQIDSTYIRGKFKLDEDNTVIRFNHYEVWEILLLSNEKLWIRNLVPHKDEWELKKTVHYR